MTLARELKRKSIHLTTSVVPLAYAAGLPRGWTIALLGGASGVMLLVEALRHDDHPPGRLFRRLFEPILRDKEKRRSMIPGAASAPPRWLGATPYCLASLFCVVSFPKPIAVLALLYLAIGDTAASFVGMTWGRRRVGEKSLEGTAALVLAAGFVALLARSLSPAYPPLLVAWAGGVAAALAELFLIAWDDNLSIPVTAAVTMSLLM